MYILKLVFLFDIEYVLFDSYWHISNSIAESLAYQKSSQTTASRQYKEPLYSQHSVGHGGFFQNHVFIGYRLSSFYSVFLVLQQDSVRQQHSTDTLNYSSIVHTELSYKSPGNCSFTVFVHPLHPLTSFTTPDMPPAEVI